MVRITLTEEGGFRRNTGSSRNKTVRIKGNTVFINNQGFSVAPVNQAEFIRQRTGGGQGLSARTAIAKAQAIATVERLRREANIRKAQQDALNREKARVELLKKQLISQGARETRKNLIDAVTRQRVQHIIIRNNRTNERIFTIKNLDTGETTTRTFQRSPTGGVFQSGGFIEGKGIEVKASPTMDRKVVVLPNGQRINISSKGRVVLGSGITKGERLEFFDGVLVKIGGKTISVVVKDTGILEKLGVDKERLTKLSAKWRGELSTSKQIFRTAGKNRDFDRLQEIYSLERSGKATPKEITERKKLEGETARNYKLAGEFVVKTVGKTIIDLGLGSAVLLNALKKDPLITLLALPSNIKTGVKKDFNTVMSGDPLNIAGLGLEYYTMAKVFQLAGKGIKAPFKLASKLSPQYFGAITGKIKGFAPVVLGKVTKTATYRVVKSNVNKLLKNPTVKANIKAFNQALKQTNTAKTLRKINKIKRRALIKRKLVKLKQQKAVTKFKSNVQFKRELEMARKIRKQSRKKGKTRIIGDNKYFEAIATLEGFANDLGIAIARKTIREFIRKGTKITATQEKVIISGMKKFVRKNLNSLSDFKKLRDTARLNKPFQIRLKKVGKINTAKYHLRILRKRISSFKLIREANRLIRKITKVRRIAKRVVRRKVGKAVGKVRAKKQRIIKKITKRPKRIVKRIKVAKARRVARAKFRETNKYLMLKSRPLRKVTLNKLEQFSTITRMNRFVDTFFDEVARRQKINLSSLKFRQLRNVTKKRLRIAIKKRNRVELQKFFRNARKIISDMNKKSSRPNVKISVIQKGKRTTKTLKDFKGESPSGTFKEVKVGNQIQLQRVETVKVRPQVKQQFRIVQVQKKFIDLKPMVDFIAETLTDVAVTGALRSATAFTPKVSSLTDVLFGSKEDFKVLQEIATDLGFRTKVVQNILQDVAQRTRSKLRLRSKLKTTKITKKIITPRPRLKKFKRVKTLKRKVMTYAVRVRRSGKVVNLRLPPLILQDAKDVMAYSLDRNLIRTGGLIPLGSSKIVAIAPKVSKGYYKKNNRKFRTFRKKKGKKISLERSVIEKRKYISDTLGEKRQLKASRKRAVKRKKVISKRKVRRVVKKKTRKGKK